MNLIAVISTIISLYFIHRILRRKRKPTLREDSFEQGEIIGYSSKRKIKIKL